jgi:hypothetical protein
MRIRIDDQSAKNDFKVQHALMSSSAISGLHVGVYVCHTLVAQCAPPHGGSRAGGERNLSHSEAQNSSVLHAVSCQLLACFRRRSRLLIRKGGSRLCQSVILKLYRPCATSARVRARCLHTHFAQHAHPVAPIPASSALADPTGLTVPAARAHRRCGQASACPVPAHVTCRHACPSGVAWGPSNGSAHTAGARSVVSQSQLVRRPRITCCCITAQVGTVTAVTPARSGL